MIKHLHYSLLEQLEKHHSTLDVVLLLALLLLSSFPSIYLAIWCQQTWTHGANKSLNQEKHTAVRFVNFNSGPKIHVSLVILPSWQLTQGLCASLDKWIYKESLFQGCWPLFPVLPVGWKYNLGEKLARGTSNGSISRFVYFPNLVNISNKPFKKRSNDNFLLTQLPKLLQEIFIFGIFKNSFSVRRFQYISEQ